MNARRIFLLGIVAWALIWTGANGQSRLISWKTASGLLKPVLTKERVLIGQAQRNALFIDVRNDPMNPTNRVNLAVVYERLGEHINALEQYKVLIEQDAFYDTAIAGMVKNLYLAGNGSGALKFIRLVESRQPLPWESLLIQSELYVVENRLSTALESLEKAWQLHGQNLEGRPPTIVQMEKIYLLNNLGYLYQRTGETRKLNEVRALLTALGG